jgi:hypothetical protein
MKYKVIAAMAHNFTQSFVSLTNFVDDQYVIDVLRDVAWQAPDRSLSIDWLPDPPIPSSPVPPIIQKSLTYFREWLPKHLQHHAIPIDALRSFRTIFAYTSRLGLAVRVEVLDDRGKLHTRRVTH